MTESAARGARLVDGPPERRPGVAEQVFVGDSEMAGRCRAFDWAATSLGPVDGWPPAMQSAARLALEAPVPTCLWCGPAYVLLYNDAYRRFFGAKHPAALGREAAAVWDEAWAQLGPQLDRVRAGAPPVVYENLHFVLERLNGGAAEDAWFTYTFVAVRDEGGAVIAVYNPSTETTAGVRATTERERLHAEAEAERQRLAAVIAHLPVGVTFAGVGGKHAISNPAAIAIWGVLPASPDVAAYSRDFIGYRPGPGPRGSAEEAARRLASHEWPLARALATGAVVRDELAEIERPDGTRRLVSLSAAPVRDADGRVTGALVTTTDVTEREATLSALDVARRTAEAAHADAELARVRTAQLQELTAALAGAYTLDDVAALVVAMTDALGARTGALAVPLPDGTALALVRTAGFSPEVEARMGRQPLELESPLTAAFRERAAVWIARRDGPEGLDVRYPLIAPVWDALGTAAAAVVPLLLGEQAVGTLSFAFSSPRTFSEAERAFYLALGRQAALAIDRARLLAAEQAARHDAELANQAKAQFLATMSHELRTPLNAIGGYAELMELGIHGPVTPEQRADLERIQRSQRHLLGLINGVLNYAKIDAGAVYYEVTDVPLDEVLRTCEALVAPQVRAKNIGFVLDETGAGLRVRADREKVQQIVLNLLSNAVKFTLPGGRITLGAAADGASAVHVTVGDTGVGIAAEQLAHVFEPFVQVDSAYTRTQEGTGLGLAISRELARGMGGELVARSTPGAGSTFTLMLPATIRRPT